MNSEDVLIREDCESERTPEALLAWIESVYAQFAADDHTKNYARLCKGTIKQFFEEIIPLGHLARHKYIGASGLYLRPKIGNQNYDAEIIDRSLVSPKIRRLEFVNAYRGYDLALRMEYLAEHGGVPMSGPVWREGTKASGGQVQAQLVAVDQGTRLKQQLATIAESIGKKLKKSYEAGTILAIVLDDYLAFDREQDLSQLKWFLSTTVIRSALTKFSGVFVIGASGRTFLEFGDTNL